MNSKSLPIRQKIYSGLARRLMKAAIQSRRERSGMRAISEAFPEDAEPGFIWFHAASAGELETLWEPVNSWMHQAETGVAVSIFSPSAARSLQRLGNGAKTNRWLALGYSPMEGDWDSLFSKHRPSVFVTARYEAWPELWCALSRHQIPLVIVAAQLRESLKLADRMTQLLGQKAPELNLLTVRPEDENALRSTFPRARVFTVGDARWDRIHRRAELAHPRVQAIAQAIRDLPHPWGVFGSAWIEDLDQWNAALKEVEGTLLIVPHDLSSANLEKMEGLLSSHGFDCLRSSSLVQCARSSSKRAVLVDEMGFLLELYSLGDWAFVGGGFGAGVHSTMEPAIFGLSIACGPKRAERFSEIADLQKTGQLKLVHGASEIVTWNRDATRMDPARKRAWVSQANVRQGATQRIVALISKVSGLAKGGLSAK